MPDKELDNKLSNAGLDASYGDGTGLRTRRLSRTRDVKLLFQINQLFKDPQQTQPYGGENILNAIADFGQHGMTPQDFQIVALVHAEGWRQILNNEARPCHEIANPFQREVEQLLAQGVEVYFCLNTARKKNVQAGHVIDGVKFVTSGVTALADLQAEGFIYIQP